MFVVDKVSCSYKMGGHKVSVLNNLSFSVKAGEFVGIQGPSGSGKSTLFYILGFLLKPTHGHIIFDNTDVTQMSTDELTLIRNKHIGFIFQQFHLLPNANCLQNILLPTVYPCELASLSESQEYEQKARYLAKQLGLSHHLTHAPNQLSGGQQQRVAIARALIKDVELILADEPTGNLDSKTAQEIMEILQELNNQGKTIILITHDAEVAKYCSKVYHLRDGSFTHVVTNYQQEIKANEKVVSKQEKSFSPTNSLDNNAKIVIANLPLVKANILRNKMKSFLTMLGVIIGVAVVLVTLTLGQFAKEKILETYESLGVNKLLVRGYPS